ncbi:hypothetical protein Tco_1563714 [Tanacetum coccineum]
MIGMRKGANRSLTRGNDELVRGLGGSSRSVQGTVAASGSEPIIGSTIQGLESKVMRKCCFVVERDAWLRGEFTLSSLDVLRGFSFFLQMGFTLILATLDGLDMGLLGDIIGEDDCDDDG